MGCSLQSPSSFIELYRVRNTQYRTYRNVFFSLHVLYKCRLWITKPARIITKQFKATSCNVLFNLVSQTPLGNGHSYEWQFRWMYGETVKRSSNTGDSATLTILGEFTIVWQLWITSGESGVDEQSDCNRNASVCRGVTHLDTILKSTH